MKKDLLKLNFAEIDASLVTGIKELEEQLGIINCADGIKIKAEECGEGINISHTEHGVLVRYGRKCEFFRALSQLRNVIKSGKEVDEKSFMTDLCFMADVSRNAVLNMASVKRLIRYMALMGYSSLMLYTEDTFEVDGYPYFGHMRGRYTKEDLREIDDYAYGFGIEVIPSGKISSLSAVQFENAAQPPKEIAAPFLSSNVTVSRAVQPVNALPLIDVTDLGIVIDLSEVQSSNAPSSLLVLPSIIVKLEGNIMLSMLEHL